MRNLSICATVAILLGGAVHAGDDAANKKEVQAIAGAWKAEVVTIDGKEIDKGLVKDWTWTWTAKGGKYTFSTAKGTVTGTFVVNAGKDPKEMDITIGAGADKGQVIKGIYKLEDATLTLCMPAKVGLSRPSEFSSKAGSGQRLIVLKRQKS